MEILLPLMSPVLLLGAWASGAWLERRHLTRLMLIESGLRDVLAITVEDVPADWQVESGDLVVGNVVISQDYFKRVAAKIKGIFGGNIGVFEPLLERAKLVDLDLRGFRRGERVIGTSTAPGRESALPESLADLFQSAKNIF